MSSCYLFFIINGIFVLLETIKTNPLKYTGESRDGFHSWLFVLWCFCGFLLPPKLKDSKKHSLIFILNINNYTNSCITILIVIYLNIEKIMKPLKSQRIGLASAFPSFSPELAALFLELLNLNRRAFINYSIV